MEQEELKKIKKIYGENFMKLCRELFPTLLEQEGVLLEILSSRFSNNSKTLYEDIVNVELEGKFKNYIYSQIDVEKEKPSIIEEKTPKQLLEEAGYDLIECTTEEEIQKFRKYYAENEELCTFWGRRLNKCVVFFAIKKDVDEIKREDFKKPKREDEYGTSVMSIQFDKIGKCTVSIKNRYNHTVNNPDATYGNDLDRIIPGLTQSFAELLKNRGLELNSENVETFEIPGYVVAGDGKYYKYNYEINGTYYCPGNTIIEHGEVKQLENPEKQVLIDYFIVDTEKKTIRVYDDEIDDSFIDAFKDLGKEDKIEIRKNKEKGTREIRIQRKEQSEPIVIEIDKDNQIIGYKNNRLEQVRTDFLQYNKELKNIEVPELRQVGYNFLYNNRALTKLEMPKLGQIGDNFLGNNQTLTEIKLPELRQVGDNFLGNNKKLTEIKMPKLEQVGDNFLYNNETLTEIKMPELKQMGDSFLYYNQALTKLEMPKLEQVGSSFLRNNETLTEIKMPELRQVGDYFLYYNQALTKLEMAKLEQVRNYFLFYNETLTEIKMPELKQVKDGFLCKNQALTELEMPKLEQIGNSFLFYNEELIELEMPKLEQVGDSFLFYNEELIELEMPKLEQVGDKFLHDNATLTEIKLPELRQVGDSFLYYNQALTKLEMLKLEQVGDNFLGDNATLTEIKMPELRQMGDSFLYKNQALTKLEMPKLEQVGNNFLYNNETLTEIKMPELRQMGDRFLYKNQALTKLEVPKLEQVGNYFLYKLEQRNRIDINDIVELDKDSKMTTSEINSGGEIISNMNKDRNKNER